MTDLSENTGVTPQGDWIDPQGRKVPAENVADADKMKDEMVRRAVAGAEALQRALAAFKSTILDEALACKELLFEQYGAKVGGEKGNITFKTFDGTLELQVAVSDRLSFGPELQAAKALIDECIETWSADGNRNIRALVEHAFEVGKEGRIDTGRVLGLRKLRMTDDDGNPDPKWGRAMDAISDALRVDGSATYVRFYRREPRTQVRTAISLDIAKL